MLSILTIDVLSTQLDQHSSWDNRVKTYISTHTHTRARITCVIHVFVTCVRERITFPGGIERGRKGRPLSGLRGVCERPSRLIIILNINSLLFPAHVSPRRRHLVNHVIYASVTESRLKYEINRKWRRKHERLSQAALSKLKIKLIHVSLGTWSLTL